MLAKRPAQGHHLIIATAHHLAVTTIIKSCVGPARTIVSPSCTLTDSSNPSDQRYPMAMLLEHEHFSSLTRPAQGLLVATSRSHSIESGDSSS
jgi:hypothetical protein